MNSKWIIGFVGIVVIAIAAFMLLGNQTATAPTTETDQQAQVSGDTAPSTDTSAANETNNQTQAQTTTVHLTASGFSPATVTVKAGDSVTFVNDTSSQMWVASAQHPTHTVYDGNNLSTHCAASYTGDAPFDQCADGKTFTFTFDKVGTWKYHNHLVNGQFGTVVVE